MTTEDSFRKLEQFVPFPRSVLTARKDGTLTPNEYELYVFIRHSANPYGISAVSLEGLQADFRHKKGWSKNRINKVLIALKKKRFLHYAKRSGRHGSFDIKLPQFSTPDGHITRLSEASVPPLTRSNAITQAEVRPRLHRESPKLEEEKDNEIKPVSEVIANRVQGSYTDTENIPKDNRFPKQSPGSFKPKNYEEEVCREIALAVGEESMAFLLGKKHKHGFIPIEQAWGIYKHDIRNKREIRDPRKYFNTLLSNLIKEAQ
ncbi:MAG: hypothetical protein WA014_01200 [Minisyncoccia bacterium]